jgi:hypothetical protein
VWQALYEELKDQNFSIITVAMDSEAEAARPYIEAAAPTYLSLIDRDHHVAELYNMVNVPQAVWIDEQGQIVRPPEPAGAFDTIRARDKSTREVPKVAEETRAKARQIYLDAIRDWVRNGASSPHVFDQLEARARLSLPDDKVVAAQANFRLGQFLLRQGKTDAAAPLFLEARRLHPASWTIWRQTDETNDLGLAVSPDFWARIDALGETKFYDVIDMDGMPTEIIS